MKTIHKYGLNGNPDQQIEMPHGARILSADEQSNFICIWVLVDTNNKMAKRNIHICLTGGDETDRIVCIHVGTVLLNNGTFVVHVFDGGEE
jgi:hypothetical protein